MHLRQMAPLGALLMLGTVTASIHAVPQQDSNAGAVTFNKQVLPILQKNCQACHRPGDVPDVHALQQRHVIRRSIQSLELLRWRLPWR